MTSFLVCSGLCPGSDLQVDAGGAGCLGPDCGDQLWCRVLLLLRHRLLWPVAADLPQEGPVLSPNTGTPQTSAVTILVSTLIPSFEKHCHSLIANPHLLT